MSRIERLHRLADRHRVVTALILALVVLLPGVAALLGLVGRHWYPTGDMAQAELHVRGLWSHPPLVGAAGRISSDAGVQGSHPGPSLWLALYPVYAIFGRTSRGLLVAVLSVHLVAAWLAIWLAGRRGGLTLMTCLAAALCIVVRASGPAFTTEPWNPWLAVLPFAAFLMASWLAMCGEHRWLIAAVALGSHCVQSHAGYAPLVLAVLASTSAALLWRHRRGLRRFPWPASALAVLAGALMWIPPFIDQVRRSPGNLSILAQHFIGPREAYITTSTAARVIVSELSAAGPWVTGPALVSRNPVFALITMGLWGWAIVTARRRALADALRLHALLLVTVVVGALSIARIFGGFQEYTIRWFWVVTAVIIAASVWTLVESRPPAEVTLRNPRPTTALAIVVAVALAFTALGTVQFAGRAQLPGEPDSRLVGALADDVAARLDRTDRYLVRWWDPVGLGATGFGLVLEMERRGFHTGVDRESAAAALPHRVMPEQTADALLYVVLGPEIEAFRAAGFDELAAADLRTPAERDRFAQLDIALRQRLNEIGRPELAASLDAPAGSAGLLFINPPLPPDVAEMVSEYVGLRLPAAVFLLPPFTAAPTG